MTSSEFPDSISEFIKRIKRLPSDRAVAAGQQRYNNYKTQKTHWLGWLGATPGSGTYERKTPRNRGARYVYNHIVEPKMLLWLIMAAGVKPALRRAAEQASLREHSLPSKSKAIRQLVPWAEVASALWRKRRGRRLASE